MNFFITNREILIDKNGNETIREDGKEKAADKLRFGTYANGKFTLFPEPDNEIEASYSALSIRKINEAKGSARFFKLLYDELSTGRKNATGNDALFFIHGFNTDLKGVREAFDTLNRLYVDNPNCPVEHVIMFTWPGMSPAIPYHYFNDKQDAIHSGEALARGIEKVLKFFRQFLVNDRNEQCNRKIHAMVHSMGHRVLKHMMLELQKKGIQPPQIFGEVLLMAADIEYTIFEPNQPFESLINLGERIHIYYHEKDSILGISKYTKNFSNRLGQYGRKRIDPTAVDVIDANVSRVTDDLDKSLKADKGNHWYYYSSSEVVVDVIRVLKGKRTEFPAENFSDLKNKKVRKSK